MEYSVSTLKTNTIQAATGSTVSIASGQVFTAPGHVIQVVQNTSTSAHTGTATDWASSGFSVTITPQSASNKVLLNINAVLSASANVVQPRFTIFRGSTNLGDAGRGFGQTYTASGGLYQSMVSTTFLDSPNTTSATTYTVYLRTNTGTYVWGADSGTQTFVAQEIAG